MPGPPPPHPLLEPPTKTNGLIRNLNPGGWAEFQDWDIDNRSDDGSLTDAHHYRQWTKGLIKALVNIDRDPCPGPKLRAHVEKAGFVNVHEKVFKIPLGPWAKDPHMKDIGMMNLVQGLDGMEAFSLKVFEMLGYSRVETEVLVANVRKELRGRAFHSYASL